jgi:peptidoglycan/LPS O-acetylase OafA/YrhL
MGCHVTTARQAHFDSLRGLAALLVVFAHHMAAFYPYAIFGVQGSYLQHAEWETLFFYPPFGLLVAGQFAVCLFFILSGYVLSYNFIGEPFQSKKIIAAIVKRPVRLGGLVLFTIMLAGLLWHYGLFYNAAVAEISASKPFFISYWAGDLDISRLLTDVATSAFSAGRYYNPPLWTIKMELYGSLEVFLFVLLFGTSKYRLFLLALLLVLTRNSLYQGFVIGVIFADMVKCGRLDRNSLGNLRALSLLAPLFLFFSAYPNYVSSDFIGKTLYGFLPDDGGFGGGYPMLAAFLLFWLVVANGRSQNILHHPHLQFLGRISYGLYVIHFLVIGSFSSWLFLKLYGTLGYGATVLAVLLVGLPLIGLAAYLVTRFVDEPFVRLASYTSRKTLDLLGSRAVSRLSSFTQGVLARRPT